MNAYTAAILLGALAVAAAPALWVLRVVNQTARWRRTLSEAPVIPISPDGNLWSDGLTWRAIANASPANAYRSPDGSKWWDGKGWHEVVK